jgi:hypothetical protein
MREQYDRSDITKTQADIDAKKADVAKDQQAISDLEDDLRRSGGDPGWENPPQGPAPDTNSSDTNPPATDSSGVPSAGNPPPASAPQPATSQDNASQ